MIKTQITNEAQQSQIQEKLYNQRIPSIGVSFLLFFMKFFFFLLFT